MWVDWMKAVGIFLIAYGHLSSIGESYVYAFNVPVFFIISGFLCKHESDNRVFWKKLWFNLIVPMLLICIIRWGIDSVKAVINGSFSLAALLSRLPKALAGFHEGVGELWFVYTLVLLKVILQFTPQRRGCQALLFVAFTAAGVAIGRWNPVFMGVSLGETCNAVVDVCLAYPFFISGFWMRRWKAALRRPLSFWTGAMVLLAGAFGLWVSGKYNGIVYMFANKYGRSLLLFFLGGYAGTAMTFVLSKWLDRWRVECVVDISKGTILILGFHMYILRDVVRELAPAASPLDLVYAMAVVLVFVPFIRFAERHLPYLIGKCRAG